MPENLNDLIGQAFGREPDLGRQIEKALAKTPQYTDLFRSIAQYVLLAATETQGDPEHDARPAKRPRTNDSHVKSEEASPPPPVPDAGPVLLSIRDVSFTSPQRKKLLLELTAAGLRGKVPGSGVEAFAVRWNDVQHAMCIPVPDKAQRQFNFCIFPRNADGVVVPPGQPPATDAIVWTVPEAPAQQTSGKLATDQQASYKSLLSSAIDAQIPRGVDVVEPNERDFASGLVQAHRKGEKAVHARAFRGSKDGYLYFLPTGILWAFKKPLMFFAFANITSVSYTSVLQRTFNMVIATPPPTDPDNSAPAAPEAEPVEHEFSMIDQEDFSGIDAYVKRHRLHDASMAEARRANVARQAEGEFMVGTNGQAIKAEGAAEDHANDPIEDADDEDEDEDEGEDGEAYDPGSEGESEGSGTSDSDDDDDGGTVPLDELELHSEAYSDEPNGLAV